MSILVVMEQNGGQLNRMSLETLAAGQELARKLQLTMRAAVIGARVRVLLRSWLRLRSSRFMRSSIRC